MATEGKTQESNSSLELPKEITFDFLKKITNDFSDERKICGDPFGTLYMGILEDGKVIAVNKLQENVPLPAGKAIDEELHHIMKLRHENVVEFVGFCREVQTKVVPFDGKYINGEIAESLLCYEYLPKGNLHDNLFGKKSAKGSSSAEPSMDWDTCFKIIKGICQGLRFLHKLDIPIIHMDLKPENIWLDENFAPKIANFALSRVFGQEQTRMCTQTVVGSYGYMAPEYLYRGEISAQADIYSLGLMIIEIATGEKNCPENNEPSARRYINKIRTDWTAERIASEYPSFDAERLQQVNACIEIGLECVQLDRTKRPPIDEIVDRLNTI